MGMVISISPVGILILGRNEKCLHCKQVYNNQMNHIVDILMSVDFMSPFYGLYPICNGLLVRHNTI